MIRQPCTRRERRQPDHSIGLQIDRQEGCADGRTTSRARSGTPRNSSESPAPTPRPSAPAKMPYPVYARPSGIRPAASPIESRFLSPLVLSRSELEPAGNAVLVFLGHDHERARRGFVMQSVGANERCAHHRGNGHQPGIQRGPRGPSCGVPHDLIRIASGDVGKNDPPPPLPQQTCRWMPYAS